MKKLLIGLILVLAVSFFGGKYYLEDRISKSLDKTAAAMSSFVDFRYRGVEVDFSGQVTIRNITIENLQQPGYFTIKDVSIQFPDFETLLRFDPSNNDPDKMPESLKVAVNGLNTGIYAIFAGLDSSAPTLYETVSMAPCDIKDVPRQIDLLRALDYDELNGDFSFGYEWDQRAENLTVALDFTWPEHSDFDIEVRIDDLEQMGAQHLSQAQSGRMTIKFSDLGYNERFLRYCFQQPEGNLGMLADQYAKDFRAQWAASGVTIGDELHQAFQYYLNSRGPMSLSFDSRLFENASQLPLYQPKDWWSLLGSSLNYGDTTLTSLDIEWNEAQLAQSEAALNPDESQIPGEQTEDAPQPSFYEIDSAAAGQYLDETVQVVTSDQKTFVGHLMKSEANRLLVAVQMGSGVATLPIQKSKIVRLSVLSEKPL